MKAKLSLLALFICVCLSSYAQEGATKSHRSLYPDDRRWMLSSSVGTNFDLSGSSSNPYSTLPGSRPEVAALLKYRVTHLFSKRLGWYADMQMNFYRERRSEYLKELQADNIFLDLITGIFEGLGEGLSFVYPSGSAGMVYRIEQGKWKIHPEIGVGYAAYLLDREKEKIEMDDNDVINSVVYRQHAHSLFLNFGVSANYFITRRCFFVFNTSFQQPLQKSQAELIKSTGGAETERLFYETTRIGRSLNASLGFGFTVGRKR